MHRIRVQIQTTLGPTTVNRTTKRKRTGRSLACFSYHATTLTIRLNPRQADSQIPTSCETFARAHGTELRARKLRHNFLLHLFNLWDNSLLAAHHISTCMAIVDSE